METGNRGKGRKEKGEWRREAGREEKKVFRILFECNT